MRPERASRLAGALEIDKVHPDDRALAQLAAAQRGVLTRAQLEAAGLGRRGIAHRVAKGRLHPLFRHVFLAGHPVPPSLARETAALLSTGPHAVLSHRTAANVHGLLPRPGPEMHLLLVARRLPRPQPGIDVHTTKTLEATDIHRPHGLPTTSPTRTLLDLATAALPDELARAV